MQHTFLQKLMLVIAAGAVAAGFYVVIYEKIIVAADESMNGDFKHSKPAAAHATPRRF